MGGISGPGRAGNVSDNGDRVLSKASIEKGAGLKEEPVLRVMELDGKRVCDHDDLLLVRFQKSDLGLEADYWKRLRPVYENGEPKLIGWYNPTTQRSRRDLDDVPEAERVQWRAVFERTIDVGDGVEIVSRDNRIDIVLRDLQRDLRSRYQKALDVVVELATKGVVKYRPRIESPTEENVREALRHRLKASGRVARYEHDVLIYGETGELLFDGLRKSDLAHGEFPNTTYLQGFEHYREQRVSQKYYNVGARAGLPLKLYKLETTFYREYFKVKGIGVEALLTQPKIQERLYADLERYVRKAIDAAGGGAVEALQAELELADGREISRALLRRGMTLTERVSDLERRVKRTEKAIERLPTIEAELRALRAALSGRHAEA